MRIGFGDVVDDRGRESVGIVAQWLFENFLLRKSWLKSTDQFTQSHNYSNKNQKRSEKNGVHKPRHFLDNDCLQTNSFSKDPSHLLPQSAGTGNPLAVTKPEIQGFLHGG
jgi:hypothetical protein